MQLEELKTITGKKNRETSIYDKVRKYVGEFYDGEIKNNKITADMVRNHGKYNVSLKIYGEYIDAQYRCCIGKGGCHHSTALAHTFIKNPAGFEIIKEVKRIRINTLEKLRDCPDYVTPEDLTNQMASLGLIRSDLAKALGTSSAHISAVKRNEARNRYFKELGSIKMACLWMIDNARKIKEPEKTKKKSK